MSKSKPIRILTLDTETYNGLKGGLKRIAIYNGVDLIYGYTFAEIECVLLDWAKYYQLHIYIHNIEFDVKKLDGLFIDGKILWDKCFVINGKIATLATANYILHDSLKILPMSLEDLSGKKGFNVEHGKVDLWERVQEIYPNQYNDKVDFLDRCDVDDPLFLEYLGYDVISLYEILMSLMRVSGISEKDFVKRVSTASLSRFMFKKGFKGHDFMCGTNKAYDVMCMYDYKFQENYENILRCAYTGGRTEVFKMMLDKKGYHYDINSLYPYCMREYPYAVGKPLYYSGSTAAKSFHKWQENKEGCGFIVCNVFIPMQEIPPLPLKMGKLTFPCGHVYGTFTFHELQYAIDNCGVVIEGIHEVLYYPHTEYIFKDFIEVFSKLKIDSEKEGNFAMRYFSKLCMNTGYGYTGMKREKTQLKDINAEVADDEILIFKNEELGYIEVAKTVDSEYIQPQVAAYVTSYARMVLLEALRYANKHGNVYYCDTDSVVTDIKLPAEMVDKYELGKFKLESEPLFAIFLKPKVYSEVFENKTEIKFKGITKEIQKSLTVYDYEYLYEELRKMEHKAIKIEIDRIQFPSVMTAIKNKKDPNEYRLQTKVFNLTNVDKRNMDYNTNTTSPLYFETVEKFDNFSYNTGKKIVNINKVDELGEIPTLPSQEQEKS